MTTALLILGCLAIGFIAGAIGMLLYLRNAADWPY